MLNKDRTFIDKLIIFSRYPVPGRTKTRLISDLGTLGAADLQRRLTEKTLRTVRSFLLHREMDAEVQFEGGNKKKMRRWLGSDILFLRQVRGNIGRRMQSAFLDAFQKGYSRVILIGTDIPRMRSDHLIQAYDLLAYKDLVLGPSIDGGYWLIGLKRPLDLFQGIEWGTEKVLEQTVSRAKDQKLAYQLLELLNDIDTIDDVRNWNSSEARYRPYISVIIPAFNEEKKIQHTVRNAIDENTEVIVADGGSDDNTIHLANTAGARVVRSRKGRAVQQNRGAEESNGKVLLFLHSDTLLPKEYGTLVFENLMDPTIILGAFRFKTDLANPLMRVIEHLVNLRSIYLKLPYGDQALFLGRASFESAGGFPDVKIAEDLLLVRKVSKKGQIGIVPVPAITSGRRWSKLGIVSTTLINLTILVGCLLGISPDGFSGIYGSYKK
ncbi:MAG: TIGR04283 family arsenosugar biosynthesis glycosyltransferase [Deltaproteobacteria bacterium]|nr:TIGR04283 family arsenosugar biosynthesis glycosyltransferase [Deltaproteobacteria bacterium]